MKRLITILFMLAGISLELMAQELTQTIRGKVIDETSEVALIGATIRLLETDPIIGQVTDIEGEFIIPNVPVGRYSIQITYVGYETVTIPNVLLHTGKSNFLNIRLKEAFEKLEEVVVQGERPKDLPIK